MPAPIEDRRPPITPQLAVRVAVLGGVAFVAVRDHLLPPLVPAGADRRRLRQPGAREPRAQGQDRGAARQHRRPQRQDARQDARRAGRADPAERRCPTPSWRSPTTYRKALAEAEGRRLAAAAGPARARAPAARRRAPVDARREAPARRRLRAAVARARSASPIGADPGRRARAALALPPARRGDRADAARRSTAASSQGIADQPSRERDDQDRRPAPPAFNYLLEHREEFPRRRRREEVPAPLPVQDARRPAVRHAARDLARRARDRGVPRRQPGHADRQGRDRGDATTSTCAAPTASRA